jgi:hypothetical protein
MSPEEKDTSFILDVLTCPITFEIFVDPVLADDGHTYERSAIVEWLKHHNDTSPITREPIKIKELKTNRIVKQLADQYRSSIIPDIKREVAIFTGNGTLLNNEQKLTINRLFVNRKKWHLIYKATNDGFGSGDFHRHCNNRGPTLTFIQTRHRFHTKNHDSIFGGYTTVPWTSRRCYYLDPEAFLFLLSENNVTRYNLQSAENIAVSHNLTSGPVFGKDDINICHRSNENHYSFSRFPSSYQDQDTNGKGRRTFSNWKHFLVSEIEVYMVVTKNTSYSNTSR